MIFLIMTSSWSSSIILLMAFLPVVSATTQDPFPDLPFQAFAEFVQENFSSKVSLATVLVVLFSTTSDPDLLNLHARAQNPGKGEYRQSITTWMKALARALEEKLGDHVDRLFQRSERKSSMSSQQVINGISVKLDGLSRLLDLHPYDDSGRRLKQLKAVSTKEIEPALVICPASMECQTVSCNCQHILLHTRDRDVPRVTSIKGIKIHDEVHVL